MEVGEDMTIELEVMDKTPLCIAQAIINHESRYAKEIHMIYAAREDIRQIGLALLNHVESCERIEAKME